ncbi:MAG: hypothetical protein HY318_19480 [Armatimonadetes bacterium]|nr:hypothetical protein [Armatimonadota bacterium]
MDHIDRVRRAIEFASPDRVPIELVDVPYVYDAYGTLNPAEVRTPAGAEDFDSMQATYHWTFTEVGTNEAGERLRREEWGCLQRVPADTSSAYAVLERPLKEPGSLAVYSFPDPKAADGYFERIQQVYMDRYADRFLCGYIDPGPFLVAFNLMGYDGLLTRLHDNLDEVKLVLHKIVDYQIEVARKWKDAGAHAVCVIDEFAGTGGLMLSPSLWRQHFKAEFLRLFEAIRSLGLYAGCLLDGDISAILEDVRDLQLDFLDLRQPHAVGIDRWAEAFGGKVCMKSSVDMMTTLASGTAREVEVEAEKLRHALGTDRGGFMGLVLRWHRPSYPEANVKASLRGFLSTNP